jgi:glycine C-acetyltransferase
MKDLFEKFRNDKGPLGNYAHVAEGYFVFPKFEGPISNRMIFNGKEMITWSINNYLGLATHPEVMKTDAESAKKWGMAYPMGARAMSGHTDKHEQLEKELAEFVQKETAYLLNFGYQGNVSIIDSLVTKDDVIVYDSD